MSSAGGGGAAMRQRANASAAASHIDSNSNVDAKGDESTRRKGSSSSSFCKTKQKKKKQNNVIDTYLFFTVKLIVLLLIVGLVGVAAWYQVALSDVQRVAWRGRAQQLYAQLFPTRLTPAELAFFDGSEPGRPIYLGIGGEIFDVSAAPEHYKKDGGYGGFSGRDATKAFFDLCFSDECLKTAHCTNLLSPNELRELATWADFYRKEPKYPFVGYVRYPSNPPPECVEAAKLKEAAGATQEPAVKVSPKP
jgi:predicted heme/steroid binding protein